MKKKWCILIKAKTLLIVLLIIITAKSVHFISEKKQETFKVPTEPAVLVQK